MELHIKIIGAISIALSAIHLVFPRYLNWSKELKALSLINRQIMGVHTFFIGLIVFLIGLLCLSSADELLSSAFGKKISLGLAIFWLLRLLAQFFGYSSAVWRGKPFETVVHVIFSFLWIYITTVFLAAYFLY